jgi:O-antigen ligase
MLYAILGYEMGITSPLFGHGYGNYDWGIAAYLPDWVSKMRYFVPNFIDSKKGFISHVLYATVFAENGILGLIAVLGFIFGPIVMLINAYLKRPEAIKLFLINATIIFAVSTFSYGFRLSNGFFLLLLILSVAYVNRER